MKRFQRGLLIILIVYFVIFICLFGITTIRKFFSKAYIVLDSGDKWMLENTKWVTLPDSENKLYNWQKYSVYTDNEYFGDYKIFYNNKIYLFNDNDKSVPYKAANVIALKGNFTLVDYKLTENFDKEGRKFLEDFIEKEKLNVDLSQFNLKMYEINHKNSEKSDRIYVANNLFGEYEGVDDIFALIFCIYDNGNIEVLYSKHNVVNMQLQFCSPQIRNVIDFLDDGKYEIIFECIYYMSSDTCHMMFEKEFGSYRKVIDC